MKDLIKIFLLGFISLCSGCGLAEWGTPTLYIQKIEGTTKLLYHYDVWGGRDSHATGYAVLEAREKFDVINVESDKLTLSYLLEIPNKNEIFGIDIELPDYGNNKNKKEIFKPISVNEDKKDGIKLNIKNYQYAGYSERSGGLSEYKFESFKETRDSIFFYDLYDTMTIEHVHLDSIKFKKGNVFISQFENREIIKIEISDLKISKVDSEIISNKKYVLKPKNDLKSNAFSDYGIFKQKT